MSLSTLMNDIDDWCGTPVPGHPRVRSGCATR